VIEKFGREHFEYFALVNFEQHPEYKECFATLDPVKIVEMLELVTGVTICPGKALLFLDVGLVKRACNLQLDLLLEQDLLLFNQGALAEQFVGQELLVALHAEEVNALFSWKREEKNSSAEIDFLVALDQWIVPIEVKSGSIGKLRSLKLFMEEKKAPLGIRISATPLSLQGNILSVPLYLIHELPRLAREGISRIFSK